MGGEGFKMKEYNIVNLMVQEGIDRAIAFYGIEGTEEVIKRIYSDIPKIKENLLYEYYKKIKG